MPVYQYQGLHYDLPDGLSKEEALSKIKKHLRESENKGGIVSGALGTAAAVGDIASGLLKVPAQAALAVGGKIADPSTSLQSTWESAGKAIEDTYPSFGKGMENNLGYTVPMKPFELYGDAVKKAADLLSFGNKDVEGAINVGANFLPIPFVKPVGKALGRAIEKIDPGLRNVKPNIPKPNIDALKPETPQPVTPGVEVPDLSIESPTRATMRVAEQNKRGLPTADDFNNRDANVRAVEEEIAANEARQAYEAQLARDAESAKGQEFLNAKQMQIDDHPFGERPPQYGVTDTGGRIDENGIPIRADLSIEAQQLQDPLQRNLWGDELPRKSEQEAARGITAAMDSLPDLPWKGSERDAALERLNRGTLDAPDDLTAAIAEANKTADSRLKNAAGNLLDALLEKAGGKLNMKDSGNSVHKAAQELAIALFDAGHTTLAAAVTKAKEMLGAKWEEIRDIFPKYFNEARIAATYNSRYPRGGLPSRPGGSQKGSVDLDLLTLGLASKFGKYLDSRSAKNLPLAQGTPKDTITHPITPETIAQKTEIRNKTEASSLLKKLAPEFSSVTTPEEAIALAKKMSPKDDINNNPVRDVTISGINGQVFLHRDNPVLNFVRYAVQQWRNSTTKFSRDYVTSKEGVATLMQKLSKTELVLAMETLRDLGKAQIELTAENIGKLGLSENVNKFMLSVRKALDAQWEMAADSLQMAGRDAFKPRAGYFPSIATGSYKSLVGVMKDGVFVTKAIAQADTRWDHKKLVEYYKEKLGKEAVVVPFERQSLNKGGITNNLFNGFNDIINTIAKHDPRFAELQQAALMKLNDAHHKLKGFDVHEMYKKGIEGFTGDNPLRTREQNAKEMSKALINFMEQGAEYYSGQKALNDIAKVTTSPDVAHLPNTLKVVEKYQKHVLGMDINPLGGGLNWVLDIPFNAIGISPKIPLAAARGLRTAVGLHMMGLWNPTFTALQLTQVLTGAWPKAQDLGSKLNMGFEVNKSASTAAMQLSVIATSHRMGRPVPDFIMPHMKEAFQYALDHGITEFSELETATSATRNKTLTQAEKLAALPIVIGERGTRPPVFMMFADIFHKFGLENQEAFMAAHHATNMAMGDYHPYERPQIYSQLGVLGEFGGALTTFKHNALTNYWTTGKNAISKDLQGNRHLLPAITALAGVALLQGITGMPGYEEADAVYQWATSLMGKRQNIAQAGLEKAPDWGKHGILSAATGLDFQSRASMANVLPDIAGSSLSPQLSVLSDMGMKLYEYYKYRDQHSFNDLMMSLTPSGMKGMTESALMTNPQGQVTNTTGQLMFNEPRTPGQQTARKWFGVRPLGETPSKEDVYVTSKSLKEREDRESDYANRFRQAFAVGDRKGMEHLSTKYLEMGGDPQVLYNSPEIMQAIQQAGEDQRTRMAGDLAATQRSIRRWQELHPGRK